MFYTPISSPGQSRREKARAEAKRRARQARFIKLIDQFEADEIETAVEGLIAELDRRDGDTDLEENGLEDDFLPHAADGPGCPVSDPGGGDANSEVADPTWTEWQTRRGSKVDANGAEVVGRDRHGNLLHEDAEDDDPREDNGDEDDGNLAEDEFAARFALYGSGPGCALTDPGEDTHDQEAVDEREPEDWV